jgi:hypothetical protein
MTIPRLELSAAALAVQVDLAVRHDMEFKVTVLFLDECERTLVVLRYINNTDRRFQTYVANRLAITHGGSQPA